VLYAGRKHSTKNTWVLVEGFRAFADGGHPDVRLILIGPGRVALPDGEERIIDLGFVSEQDKRDAYAAATVLCQPSLNESFSLVMMEAWACGTPCLVHGDCRVTRDHVVASGGGLYFTNTPEFVATLNYLVSNPATAREMGEAGGRYVRTNFSWGRIIDRYCEEVFA